MAQKTFGNLLLSIGAMKAGTTWLYTVLERHPALHFTPEKELHYFFACYVRNRFLNDNYRVNSVFKNYLDPLDPKTTDITRVKAILRWVADYLDGPVDDTWYSKLFHMREGQSWACDFSNLHAFVPAQAWPKISEKCDQLRVIYSMRHPLKRLWSHTKFELQVNGRLQELDSWQPRDFDRFVRQPHVWDNAEYGAVLRRMSEGLRPEERKVLFYENIHDDRRGVLREIEGFLGIPAFNYPGDALNRRHNESASRPMPDFFEELFSKDIARICREVEDQGFTLPESWR